jgi:hypothetical protein
MEVVVARPDLETVRLKVSLVDSKDPRALEVSLDALLRATFDLGSLLRTGAPESDLAFYLVTTFHTPHRTWLRERRFFERCAKHEVLHAKMLRYAEQVNTRARGLDVGFGDGLGHSDMRPAGCFAVVPLALADARYVDAIIAHMRGTDMDHESFHAALIERLLQRHGVREETLRLLVFRAVDGAGQHGRDNLVRAVKRHRLLEELPRFGGLEGLAARVMEQSRRTAFLPLYVSNAGKALFTGDPEGFARWIALFEQRGMVFEAEEKKLPDAVYAPMKLRRFKDEWEQDGEELD